MHTYIKILAKIKTSILNNNSKTLLIHGMVVHATVMLVDSFKA
jgi:hypothetical protein